MSRLVSSNDWKHTDTLSWTIDDTLINTGKYDIHLEIRNDIRYPYENIGLEVTILSSDSVVQTKDTVNYRLADKNGHWTGSGWGCLYQSEFLFLTGTQLQDSAVYTILVRQAMIDKNLKGINSIGVRISKKQQ